MLMDYALGLEVFVPFLAYVLSTFVISELFYSQACLILN